MDIGRKRIYLDYASLTPIDRRVLREIKKYSGREYANPSSIYREGVAAKRAMEDGRKRVAEFLHAHADEIVFTSGGTDANGLAIEGAGRAARHAGIEKPHLIISNIEHSSVIEMADMMERHGVEVTRLAVDKNGLVDLDDLKKAIKPNTFLVSIMTVNNEIGSVQPMREIAKAIRRARKELRKEGSRYPLFHTDAAQAAVCAALVSDLNVEQLGVDLLTLDGSKVYGPRGIGALYVRRGTPIEEIVYGGGQERGLRSGTENLPAIMGFAKALDIASAEAGQNDYERSYFIESLKRINPAIAFNPADQKNVAPHILNVAIPGIDNEFFVLQLDAKGIAVSTKSSCQRDEDESYVLKAIGADSKTSVRFSFGRWTPKGDLKKALKIIGKILSSAPKVIAGS
jgi:cysteine desulfurase